MIPARCGKGYSKNTRFKCRWGCGGVGRDGRLGRDGEEKREEGETILMIPHTSAKLHK